MFGSKAMEPISNKEMHKYLGDMGEAVNCLQKNTEKSQLISLWQIVGLEKSDVWYPNDIWTNEVCRLLKWN